MAIWKTLKHHRVPDLKTPRNPEDTKNALPVQWVGFTPALPQDSLQLTTVLGLDYTSPS